MLAVLAICVAGYFIFFNKEEPAAPVEEPRIFVWDFDMEELYRIEIILPKVDMSGAWVKHEDRQFYFDEPDGVKVDVERWGGGIPLILSGPGAERSIVDDAIEEIEKHFDNAYLVNMPYLTIIHGKGSGRLRQAVRQWLKSSRYVKSFSSGGENEGGDGVTVVKFKSS